MFDSNKHYTINIPVLDDDSIKEMIDETKINESIKYYEDSIENINKQIEHYTKLITDLTYDDDKKQKINDLIQHGEYLKEIYS